MLVCTDVEGEAVVGLLKLKRMLQSTHTAHPGYQYKTPLQIHVLSCVFEMTSYPSCRTRQDLAVLLNMSPRSIQIWLQNARAAARETAPAKREADGARVRIFNAQDILVLHLISLVAGGTDE